MTLKFPKPTKKIKGTLTLSDMRKAYKDACKVVDNGEVLLVSKRTAKLAKLFKTTKKKRRVLKPRWIRPGQVKTYDDAVRYLRMIDEGKRRAEQSAYEAILTQLFQYKVRTSGDCVLREIEKPWKCGGIMQAGHVFTRSIKELKWDERNCYPQCFTCNSKHRNFPFIFHDWCRAHIGEVEYDKLKTIARFGEVFIISFSDVMKLIEKYSP